MFAVDKIALYQKRMDGFRRTWRATRLVVRREVQMNDLRKSREAVKFHRYANDPRLRATKKRFTMCLRKY